MSTLRDLPQVDQVLRDVPELASLGPVLARWLVRREVDAARERSLAGGEIGDVRAAVGAAASGLKRAGLRRVVNATGVVLHTNLGRAPLSDAAIAAVVEAARATNVEFDSGTGERGARAPVAATLAAALCETEDALVVNNNAGALLLALAALAKGREVVVARGELIEIGGEFRLPDVMEASGAILREVGTTNRTRAKDYRKALGERTGLVLKVHPSNYRVVGFTAEASLGELVEVAREGGVPLLFDTGSGLLRPDDALGEEPDAASALATGADLVCFSGDKLLGGPQAGILAGRAELVERCRRHPLARAVRADKLTLAALEATLWAHAHGEVTRTGAMLRAGVARLRARAEAVAAGLGSATVEDGESVTGGGSLPGVTLPTAVVVVATDRPAAVAARLRAHVPPVVGRIESGRVLLDLRTVDEADDVILIAAARAALEG